MNKISVNNIAATAIIYSVDNPSQIFIERKTDDYPVKVFAGVLCTPGGNWVGHGAKDDANPEATIRRELEEEFSLVPSEGGADEMGVLGYNAGADGRDLQKNTQATAEDIECFAQVKEAMLSAVTPFMDALVTIPKTLFDSADPENKRGDTTLLISYFLVGLSGEDWDKLVRLQEKYGNLSNESETRIVTVDEMCQQSMKVSWGHDRALGHFLLMKGIEKRIPTFDGISCQLRKSLSSYNEYKETYEIARQPQ